MADTYTPTSPDGQALAKLRRMVALSLTFRTLVAAQASLNVTTNTEAVYQLALARVLYEYIPKVAEFANEGITVTNELERPFSSLWPMGMQTQVVAGGDQYHMRPRGQVYLYLAVDRDVAVTTWNDRRLKGIDFLANWLKDITDLSGADDTSALGSVAVTGEGHLAVSIADAQLTDQVPFKMRHSAAGESGSYFWRHSMITFGDET